MVVSRGLDPTCALGLSGTACGVLSARRMQESPVAGTQNKREQTGVSVSRFNKQGVSRRT